MKCKGTVVVGHGHTEDCDREAVLEGRCVICHEDLNLGPTTWSNAVMAVAAVMKMRGLQSITLDNLYELSSARSTL